MFQNSSYESRRDNIIRPCCWENVNDCYPAHFHKTIEIVYVKEGRLDAVINGLSFTGTPGCLLLSSSYFIHAYQTREASREYILTVPYDAVKPYHSLLAKQVFASSFLPASPKNAVLIRCLEELKEFCSSYSERDPMVRDEILTGYTNAFIGLLIERVGLVDAKADKVVLFSKDILRYLQENYLTPLTLDAISHHFGYSKSRFSHIFNQYFGCSLTEYVNTLRCRHACQLLLEKHDATITDISLACGFNSIRTFYRAFHRYAQVTPTEYAARKAGSPPQSSSGKSSC